MPVKKHYLCGMIDEKDIIFMRRALTIAEFGRFSVSPNPMVGAVIVADGKIIGEGWHRKYGEAHAEVNAIKNAEKFGKDHMFSKSTVYVTLEPCAHYGKTPPCAKLLIEKGVKRVVVGCKDPFESVSGKGIEMLHAAGVEVDTGCLEDEAKSLNTKFLTAHNFKRPYITLKWAQSSDGYIDSIRENGGSAYGFSTSFTSVLVHRLRACHDAILVGSSTVISDNPRLTVRNWIGRNPVRVVVDRRRRLTGKENIFSDDAKTLVYACPLRDVLSDLYSRSISSLLVEGGAAMLKSFIDENLFDEIRVETAPVCLRDGVKAPLLPGNINCISEKIFQGNEIRNYKKK